MTASVDSLPLLLTVEWAAQLEAYRPSAPAASFRFPHSSSCGNAQSLRPGSQFRDLPEHSTAILGSFAYAARDVISDHVR